MVGRQIDRYRLVEEIGSGGMAVVYRGVDTALDREVAVKVMHPHLAGKEESRKRFRREAKAVAKLRHPYILEIYDFSGDEAKESFIVTEYVRGRTLRAYGEEVGFALPELATLAVDQLCEALQHAHDTGIVHRDLKPENVMVREDGVLKLMDFGIARMVEADEKMTMTGALVGSPLHMAPETIEGRGADHRADIFAIGTIWYWLVTGKMAFQGATTTQTLRQILEGQYVDPRMLNAACSDEIGDAIARCLHKDPAQRFASVAELRAAIRKVLDEAGIERVEPELKAYFEDPKAATAAMRARLVARLTSLGEKALAEKRQAKALSYFNRVLALDEKNAAVLAHLEGMKRAKKAAKRRRAIALAALALLGVSALGAGGVAIVEAWPEEAPVVEAPPETAPEPLAVAPPPEPSPEPAVEPGPAVEPPPVEVAPKPAGDPVVAKSSEPRPKVQPRGTPPPPTKVAAAAKRRVRVLYTPQTNAILKIDGESQDLDPAKPVYETELVVGKTYNFGLLVPDCCMPDAQAIPIKEGDGDLEVRLKAPPKPATVLVRSNRPEATIFVGSSPKGKVSDIASRGGFPVSLGEAYRKKIRVDLVFEGKAVEKEIPVEAGKLAEAVVDFP